MSAHLDQSYTVPDLHCPVCHALFNEATPITNAPRRGFHKGLLIVCVYCASVAEVGDASLQRVGKAQFAKLPLQTQRNLVLAIQQVHKAMADKK